MRLSKEVIDERMKFAESVNYDYIECSKHWRISRNAAKYFILSNKTGESRRPEYENQRLFDLQVLYRHEWCAKYNIPVWEYDYYLAMYERKHGEIATPEIRDQWMREYWERM